MLFSEVYSCYFNTVAAILTEVIASKKDKKSFERKMIQIIREKAFDESVWNIMDSLKSEEWPFLTKDYETPIQHIPTQPLTILQKRWMKAILQDPRMKLFGCEFPELEEVEPLFDASFWVYYDRYQDGDPYHDEKYIEKFQSILEALKNEKGLYVKYIGRRGVPYEVTGIPRLMEYSEKDDKFRLKMLVKDERFERIMDINVVSIVECKPYEIDLETYRKIEVESEKKKVIIKLIDEKDALRRAMLHFSYLEKETMQMEEGIYQITLFYDRNDEIEIILQILSFGPLIEVMDPQDFRNKLKERIVKQREWLK